MGLMSREKSVGQDERPSPILPGFPQSAMMQSMRLTKGDPSRPVKKTSRPLQKISFLPVTIGGQASHPYRTRSVTNAHRDFAFQEPFSRRCDSFPQLEQGLVTGLLELGFQSILHLDRALQFLLRISPGDVILAIMATGSNRLTWRQLSRVRLCVDAS